MTALLPLLLLAPTIILIVWLYWAYPKSLPRTSARRTFDVFALLIALGVAVAVGRMIEIEAVTDVINAAVWAQVLAVLYSYGAFLVLMIVAAWVRWRLFRPGR